MKKLNNTSGFTLIEIIVVLIIVGILAAIALPNIFQNVTKSQATAALATADADKTPLEQCFGTNPSDDPTTTVHCTAAVLNLPTPANGWTLDIVGTAGSTAALGDLAYDVVAYDKSNNIGATLVRSANGSWKCVTGANAYNDVC